MTAEEIRAYEEMAKLDLDDGTRRWAVDAINKLEEGFPALAKIDTQGVAPMVNPLEADSSCSTGGSSGLGGSCATRGSCSTGYSSGLGGSGATGSSSDSGGPCATGDSSGLNASNGSGATNSSGGANGANANGGAPGVMREDIAVKLIGRDELLAHALDEYDGYFQAPRLIE